MNFDEFFSCYQKLKASIPRNPDYCYDNEDISDCGYVAHSKNCYYCFDCYYMKSSLYCYDSVRSTNCVDCDYAVDCELLYECLDVFKAYNSAFLNYCARTYDSYFCYDCNDSHDLFGCAHLNHKQYCIFNKQYTKEGFFKETKELLKIPPEELLNRLDDLVKKYPFGPSHVSHSENSSYGNHIHYSSNCYLSFDAAHDENCGYLYDSHYCKDSYDLTQCVKVELCYECVDAARCYNCNFVEWSNGCFDCSYLYACVDCHNCWGCVGLKQKKYSILNKQYTEEEYNKIVSEIKQSAR